MISLLYYLNKAENKKIKILNDHTKQDNLRTTAWRAVLSQKPITISTIAIVKEVNTSAVYIYNDGWSDIYPRSKSNKFSKCNSPRKHVTWNAMVTRCVTY